LKPPWKLIEDKICCTDNDAITKPIAISYPTHTLWSIRSKIQFTHKCHQ